ncbi:unannotated protein [freshwater metagenome]|uniref:Unannotated protein n=1 Tax=freshwater metagenome TaxID=449393 RepID=A0A6J7UCL1_9ZZZZ
MRPSLNTESKLLTCRCHGDDLGSMSPRNVNHCQTDSACGAKHDHPFFWRKLSSLGERVPSCCIALCHRRCLRKAQAVRNGNDLRRAQNCFVGKSAESNGCKDPVADVEALNLFAYLGNLASNLRSWDERQLRPNLVFALHKQCIHIVQPASPDMHSDLMCRTWCSWKLFYNKGFGLA